MCMKIVSSGYKIISPFSGEDVLKHIELCGRTAYQSEDKITDESAKSFIERIMRNKHQSVIEHFSVTVKVICDRGVSHEIVRHRLASYTQESTRYCNYSKGKYGNEITVIRPSFFRDNTPEYLEWLKVMEQCEESYMNLLARGHSPQEARSVLPNSLKTAIVVTMNLRNWHHFFELRTAPDAHPQMREIAIPMCQDFKSRVPVMFDDILC